MSSKRRRSLEPPEADTLDEGPLTKQLQALLDDPAAKGIVQWCADKESFAIISQQRFEDALLPKHFAELGFQAFLEKLRDSGFLVQQESVWVALHPTVRTKNGSKHMDELLEPLLKRTESGLAAASRPITSQSPALPAPVPQQGLSDAIVLATLSKMIEHQAVIVQTIQRMEKEVEQTRQHQQMLANILESLSEPNTPATSGEGANASV